MGRSAPLPSPDSQFYIGKKKNTDVIDGQSCIYLDTVFNDVSGAMAPNMLFCTTLKYLLLHLWVRHDDLRSPDSGRSIQKERHSVVELTHLPELRLEEVSFGGSFGWAVQQRRSLHAESKAY